MKLILRGKRLTGKFHFTRWGIVSLAVVVALAAIGVTYAGWADKKSPKDRPVETAECSDPFTWVVSNDDGNKDTVDPYGLIDPGDDGNGSEYDYWELSSSADPSAPQLIPPPPAPPFPVEPCARYNKDVAKTEATKLDDYNIEVTVTNAYPSYYPTVFFALECPESVSGGILDIVIDEIADDAAEPEPDIIPELTVTYSGIFIGQPLYPGEEVVGALHIHVEQEAEECHTYKISLSIITTCVAQECGTAYAYYNDILSTCFLDMDEIKTNNWGWSNGPLEHGNYTFDFYAGAGGCDISAGELVGTVTVDYDDVSGNVTVTYELDAGYTMDVIHLYVGNEILPRNKKGDFTVSPGQYPHTYSEEDMTEYTHTFTGLSGDIYVVAHAVACWFPD